MAELLELLQDQGFDGYRDARGPMGFTQRQGNGKFTSDEADAFIAQLHEEAENGRAEEEEPSSPPPPPPRRASSTRRLSPIEAAVRKADDAVLVAELERRGWTVTPGQP
ncbi:MAG: hypothetical protein P8N02_04655 [Actinomycetota bacterium]|nr:hypothetical protein [Actinomycetota bacterium]